MSLNRRYRRSKKPILRSNSSSAQSPLRPRPPVQAKPKMTFDNYKPVRFMVNLEDMVVIEKDLAFLLEDLSIQSLSVCEDFWDITDENTLNQIEQLYRDPKSKKNLKMWMVLGSLAVALIHHMVGSSSTQNKISTIKEIVFNLHQGFLVVVKLILKRISENVSNEWVLKLKNIVKAKLVQKNQEKVTVLKNCNISVRNGLRSLCSTLVQQKSNKNIMISVTRILEVAEKASIKKSRAFIEKAFGIDSSAIPSQNKNIPQGPLLKFEPLKPYTLVLDLDETLVHYVDTEEPYYAIRPHTQEFLNQVSEFYEVVIFTAGVQEYADWVLNVLDKDKVFSARLYRQHTVPAGNVFVKDLSLLGRDLKKVVIVDNVAENFELQNGNGILIRSWYGDQEDKALLDICFVLVEIAKCEVEDVRKALKSLREHLLEQISQGDTKYHYNFKSFLS